MFLTARTARRVRSDVSGKSRVQQGFKDECDINRIVKRANVNGYLPPSQKEPHYMEVPDAVTYHEALNIVLDAEERFMALPSQVRKNFQNNPEEFLAFAQDPKNHAEMVKMGLANKRDDSNDAKNKPDPKTPEAKNMDSQQQGEKNSETKVKT